MHVSNTTLPDTPVRGAGHFPAFAVLIGFIAVLIGMVAGNAWIAAAGTAVLLASIVGIEYIIRGRRHRQRRHWHNPSSVIRHV